MSLQVALVYDCREDYRLLGYSAEQIAEFDVEETIDALADTLATLGFAVERVGHIKSLVKHLATGKRWDIVFNIAEGLQGIAREAQVPALLEAYDQPYTFSSPETLMICHHKGWAKQQLQQAGLATSPWQVIHHADISHINLPYPLFIKPVAEGTGKGISQHSIIHDRQQLIQQFKTLHPHYPQGLIVEPYLTGREFTVGLLGSRDTMRPIGVLEVVLKQNAEPGGHTYFNKANCEHYVDYPLATDAVAIAAQTLALNAAKTLGCVDACRVDIRCDNQNNPYFLEVNPLPGLNPTFSDLSILANRVNMPYASLVEGIMQSALARYPNLQTKLRATA